VVANVDLRVIRTNLIYSLSISEQSDSSEILASVKPRLSQRIVTPWPHALRTGAGLATIADQSLRGQLIGRGAEDDDTARILAGDRGCLVAGGFDDRVVVTSSRRE
jgi:hypothetical protein